MNCPIILGQLRGWGRQETNPTSTFLSTTNQSMNWGGVSQGRKEGRAEVKEKIFILFESPERTTREKEMEDVGT